MTEFFVILSQMAKNLFRQYFINLLLKDAEVQHDIQVTVTLNLFQGLFLCEFMSILIDTSAKASV